MSELVVTPLRLGRIDLKNGALPLETRRQVRLVDRLVPPLGAYICEAG